MNYDHLARTRLRTWFGFCRTVTSVLFLAASLGLASNRAHAQEGTGTIQGRVSNASNGMYLGKARVAIDGTSIETFTNDYGEFILRDVPAGPVKLVASFTGLQNVETAVVVVGGQSATTNLEFSGEQANRGANGEVILDPFVVESERFKNARDIAINEERYSVNIKNVVSVDEFGNIPSNNVGDFVKFLPGVQVSYGAFGGNSQGYADSEPSGISVRGFGPDDTAVLIDGLPVSNATPGSLSRQVGLDQLAINNASRVELIKVATPDMPNNSMGGQVNLVTKSAFEFAKPSFTARAYVNFNSLRPEFSKTPGPINKETRKTTPGAEFSVSYPFSDKFGMSFTGSIADTYNQTYRGTPTYTMATGTIANSAGNVVSLTNPVLTRFQIADTSSMVSRKSGNLRFDWRPTSTQLLKLNVQYSTYESEEAQRNLDARPTFATGANWDGTFTTGTTANSTLDMVVRTRDKVGSTKSAQAQYELNVSGWRVAAAASISESTGDYRDRQNGHFSEIGLKLNPGQVNFSNIRGGIPGSISTFRRVANGGTALDFTQLANWGFDTTVAKSGEAFSKNTVGLYKLDVERDLSFLRFIGSNSLTFKFGARRDTEKTDKSGLGTGYQEDLIAGKSYAIADIRDDSYLGQTPGFGYAAQEWGSTYKLYELNKANQLFVAPADGATAVNTYNSFVNQQKHLTDTKDGLYAMLSGRFLRNRLSVVGGIRQESSARDGRGPFTDTKWNYAKNADGTLYFDDTVAAYLRTQPGFTDPTSNNYKIAGVVRLDQAWNPTAGAPEGTQGFLFSTTALGAGLRTRLAAAKIPFPDHVLGPTASSLESRKLNLIPLREIHTKRKGRPSYSLSTAFKLTKKIDLKVAWSRSFGLPALENGVSGILSGNGAFSINENSPVGSDGVVGVIAVANPNIKPQTSDNWDFEASYYTETGGKLSVSYYRKSVTDQIVNFSSFSGTPEFDAVLPVLGLDPEDYLNWRLNTSSNSTTKQQTSGFEYEVRQDFRFLGGIGKNFSAFASLAIKELAAPATVNPVILTSPTGVAVPVNQTVSTITLTANRFGGAGIQYNDRRITAQIRGTYRNDNEIARSSLPNGNFLRRFEPSETRIDVNLNLKLTERYDLFVSGRDVFNGKRVQVQRDDVGLLPPYARTFDSREFGVTWTAGVSGRF